MSIKADNKQIVLNLKDSKLTSQKFVKAVDSFFGLLKNVGDSVGGTKDALKWYVSVRTGSVQIIAEPEQFKASRDIRIETIKSVRSGVSTIEKRDERPPHFTDIALRHVRRLAALGNGDSHGPVRLEVGKRSQRVTLHTVQNVDNILKPARELDGSIEGRLTVISGRKGLKVVIDDILTGKSIECTVKPDKLKDVLSHFGQRCVASGIVRYRRDGDPTSIVVDEFRWLRSKEDLPSYKEVRGIL